MADKFEAFSEVGDGLREFAFIVHTVVDCLHDFIRGSGEVEVLGACIEVIK